MKFITFSFVLSLSFLLLPIHGKTQCATSTPNIDPWFSQDPNSAGVGIFKEDSGFQYLGVAMPGTPTIIEVNISEVNQLLFATICKSSQILHSGLVSNIGTICSETFECTDDFHYYTLPTVHDPYNYPLINLKFSSQFGGAPDVFISLDLTGCGVQEPVLTSPASDAANLGTTVQFTWDPVPNATDYILEVAETCFGCPITTNNLTGTTISVSNLNANSSYVWRVKASNNLCADSAWSSGHFWTGNANSSGPMICNFFGEGLLNSQLPFVIDHTFTIFSNTVFCTSSSITLGPGFTVELGGSFFGKTN